MSSRIIHIALLLGAFALGGCGGVGEDEPRPLSCEYERRTTSCNSTRFNGWESKCSTIEYPRDDLTTSSVCDGYRGSDTHCQGGCCLQFQFRGARGFAGTCP